MDIIGAMSKHDIIADNLMALTRSRSFERALDGWSVKKLVALSKVQQQACELCGTRFRDGAIVVHRTSSATVVVGGTCLRTLQEHRFPSPQKLGKARQFTLAALRSRYGDLVDPGNWLLWVRRHAPPRLAQPAADFYLFGAVLDSAQLHELIRFHDSKRLFPRNALLSDAGTVERALGIKIPKFITIAQARRFLKAVQRLHSTTMMRRASAEYMKKHVVPRVREDPDLEPLWRDLGPLARRAGAAFAALDGFRAGTEAPLVDEVIASKWPRPGTPPMFVWNHSIGLGFVAKDDVFDPPKAYVWLWRSGRYRKAIYSLAYWRGVVDASGDAVGQLEVLAFGKGRTFLGAGAAAACK